jgi:hypothetical protein
MQEYVFEVKLVAAVRVRAPDESLARKVLTSNLSSPSVAELRLATDIDPSIAKNATITLVAFSPTREQGVAVPEVNDRKTVNQLPPSLPVHADSDVHYIGRRYW